MYLRSDHADADTATLRRLIRENPLGILTTALPSDSFPLIQCSHIPFLLDIEDETSETEQGTLRGHMARANPHSKALIEAAKVAAAAAAAAGARSPEDGRLEHEVLVLFNLPVQHYVTPQFYTETKPDTGKVVPTWNYAAVQVYGRIRVHHDSGSEDAGRFLGRQVSDLSDAGERSIMGYTGGAWKIADAPAAYVERLKKAIIGIEITVDRLQGKFKMSQEMSEGDRAGVVAGFRSLGTELGTKMSELVQERSELKKARKAAAQPAH
ncbi:transcriptional regulator [Cordyceps javanica]|uniref:Transcriptional regulator n=1 Tax=Cordyceps javanica TaxID=43265 RepID=A0A545W4I9_9HYPO|nr:transcriptional regulator [Cordyceps javanica]TQW08866.1 transcriptional regulator [Cordyceps javanica]